MVGPTLDYLYGMAPLEPATAEFLLKIDDVIVREAILKLEELIKEVASIHGGKTPKDVRKLLVKRLDVQEHEGPLKEYFAKVAPQPRQAPPADSGAGGQSYRLPTAFRACPV
jgi:2,3-bisphosphoglycerate-independent phosphoglycerate mutase